MGDKRPHVSLHKSVFFKTGDRFLSNISTSKSWAASNVTINVINEWEQWEKWNLRQEIYTVQISESTIPKTFLINVSGREKCPVAKYLTKSNFVKINDNGDIFLNRPLDYETSNYYRIQFFFSCSNYQVLVNSILIANKLLVIYSTVFYFQRLQCL